MNLETMRIHSKAPLPGGIQDKNEKNKASLKSLKNDNRLEKSKYKPLCGKIFYLDLPSITVCEKLQKDIKDLGGRVEEFLSKDISYLVSNKKEAKYAQTLGRNSPVPSPESAYTAETTSPHPSHDGSSFKSPDRVCLSRGKFLAEKAVKDHDFIPANSILSNALSWGVKILHIDDIRYYIEQKKKELCTLKKSSNSVRDTGKKACTGIQKARTGRLKKPFLKVEDVNRSYRPFYLQLTSMPSINYSTQTPCSPFDGDKPSNIQKQAQPKVRITTDGDKCGGTPVQLQLKEKRKKGYCECCLQKYEDLETHLLSEKHRNFAQSNQYQVVDDIISKLVFDFVEYERDTPKKKRIKYSIGSLSSVSANVLRNTEPKEKLQLEPIFQDMGESNGQLLEQNFQYEETQEPEPRLVFASEPMSYCSAGLKRWDEKTVSTFSASEPDLKQNCPPLPPCKNEQQEGIPDDSEHKLIINKNDSIERGGDSLGVPQSCVQVSCPGSENSTPQPKLTADITHSSSKRLQHDSDLVTLNTSKEHLRVKARTPSCSPEEPNEYDTENVDNLPCGRIQRKVRLLLERKKNNVDPSAELGKKRAEFPPACEDRTCGSPVQSLLDLFQTSGEKSEFLGFTSYTENSGMCDVLDIWEEENSSSLLSTFFSSPSASAFVGF
ncbi:protein DBF4 homolog A [Onychomys torridus]|uniref:protein DBF4 homolog A n=1 Tax=Onychomys torridus TaxID=38674 RepID=UPI00167F3A57|nr:protein DBF4 homolog A [Onychomys torridus]